MLLKILIIYENSCKCFFVILFYRYVKNDWFMFYFNIIK